MSTPPVEPGQGWRSYIDDDDDEQYQAPDPFAEPAPSQGEDE